MAAIQFDEVLSMLQALYWSFYQWKWNASSPGGLLHSDHTWSNSSILSSIMKPESTCVVGRLLYYDRMSRVYCNNCFFIQLPCIDNHDSDFCYIVIIYSSSITAHYPLHGLMSWTTIIIQSLGWLLAGGPMVACTFFIHWFHYQQETGLASPKIIVIIYYAHRLADKGLFDLDFEHFKISHDY